MNTVTLLKCKIHRATVTGADLNYVGSLTLDPVLMEAAGLHEYEKVLVADITKGSRLETYIIRAERGSGEVCINGAAAHLVAEGDLVIIMAFREVEEADVKNYPPTVVFVDEKNSVTEIRQGEEWATQ